MTFSNSEKLSNFKVHALSSSVNEFVVIQSSMKKDHLILTRLVKNLRNELAIKTLGLHTNGNHCVSCYSPSFHLLHMRHYVFLQSLVLKNKQTNKQTHTHAHAHTHMQARRQRKLEIINYNIQL